MFEIIRPSATSAQRRSACSPMAAMRIGMSVRRSGNSSRTPSTEKTLPV